MRVRNLDRTQGSFNSRTREGCDESSLPPFSSFRFQFTHPRGVRFMAFAAEIWARVSIHAPARGAMRMSAKWPMAIEFQFTHPRGVR